ncbi:MAG: glucose 1-dehydrogenase [Sphingomonadales bacterium]
MFNLSGKVILISGAARANGQGAAEAHALAQAGATVYITDILDETGVRTAQSLGPAVHYRHLDVTLEADWQKIVQEILDRDGRLDGLVNNAGVWSKPGLMDTDADSMRRVIEVNQMGVFLGMKAVAPAMQAAGKGSIVNIGSAAAERVGVYYWHNTMTAHAYTATKWAVRGMTKAAAMELAPHGVRVNVIHPGPIQTAMLGGDLDDIARSVPVGRLGQAADIAPMVVYLMADESGYLTGADLSIDGAATV